MRERNLVFQYRKGGGILCRIPALPKLALVLGLALILMFLPFYAIPAGILAAAAFARLCGFTPREQLADVKPVLFYAAFLYLINIFSHLASADFAAFAVPVRGAGPEARRRLAAILYPDSEYGLYALRLLLVMQLSALFFRTTTSTEIKGAILGLEANIRRVIRKLPFTKSVSPRAKFGTSLALTISFIPELFSLWERINRAYRARGGRGGLKKARVLLVSLFSLAFSYADKKARALAARDMGGCE
ncbi:MAG: energy-coupling factor transporter transmembrane protein EcfT [Treponema sp.]|jgi:biotin transport system permease protein/energy-coupling factor transport system permease protein|nr:energy-coupling factor transporter transmembrane protein EcfT [Treponema sp.]